MSSLLQLLARHGLAAFAGTLAAQGLTVDASSTVSLVTALIIFAWASLWSWIAKLKWGTDYRGMNVLDDTTAEMIRKLIGAFVSQGMAAFSGYLATQGHAVNVDDPVALSVFGANLALSKAGVQQKLAKIGAQDVLKILLVSLSPCLLVFGSSCAPLSVSQREAITQTIVPISQLGLSLAQSRGIIQEGDKILIGDGLALILDDESSRRDKVVKLSALGVQAAVERGVLKEGDALIIQQATAIIESAVPQTSAKQPQNVQPVKSADDADSETILEGPEPTAPVCEEPRGEALPACLKITPAITIPRYGVQVAAALRPAHSTLPSF